MENKTACVCLQRNSPVLQAPDRSYGVKSKDNREADGKDTNAGHPDKPLEEQKYLFTPATPYVQPISG